MRRARTDFGCGDDDSSDFDEGVEVMRLDGPYGCGCEVSSEEDLDEGCLEDGVGGGVGVLIGLCVFGIVVGLCIGDFIVVIGFVLNTIWILWLMIDERSKGICSRSFKRGHDEGWLTKDEIEEGRIVLSHMCQIDSDARLVVDVIIISVGSAVAVRTSIGAVGSRGVHVGGVCVAVDVRVVTGCSSMHS